MELREEHLQLASRFAQARATMEEALEARTLTLRFAHPAFVLRLPDALPPTLTAQVKDRTIDQLAAALDAREEALERHASSAKSLEVRACAEAVALPPVRAADMACVGCAGSAQPHRAAAGAHR